MMWYLKKDMFCREHIFFGSFVIFKTVCPLSVFGRSGRHPSSSGHFPHGTRSCICTYFVCTLIFMIVCMIVLAITCTIVRTIFSIGPGFKPLALHMIYFVGPGFDPLPVQHDLFVGPGFKSRTQSPVSGP